MGPDLFARFVATLLAEAAKFKLIVAYGEPNTPRANWKFMWLERLAPSTEDTQPAGPRAVPSKRRGR